MEPLLKPIASDMLKKLFLSDDLTTDFIKNKDYASNQNVIHAATVLLSYYENMNKVNDMLSNYSMLIKSPSLSSEKKQDMEVRIKLLTYVSAQKKEIDKVDTNKIIDSILQGKKERKSRRTKKSRTKSRQTKRSRTKSRRTKKSRTKSRRTKKSRTKSRHPR
jgi:hypothetical protein